MVGSAARMRVSSVIVPFSIGTLKSTRMKTFRPLRERSRMVVIRTIPADEGLPLEPLLFHVADQIDAAARVAPLVVVPRQDLDEVAVEHLRVRRVENRRVRVALEVDRDQ